MQIEYTKLENNIILKHKEVESEVRKEDGLRVTSFLVLKQ